MTALGTLSLGLVTLLSASSETLTERTLGDVAVIRLPTSIKEEMYKGVRTDQPGRVVFTFGTSWFWASFGSSTAYRHLIFVSVMAPDVPDNDYAEFPKLYRLRYENRKTVRKSPMGSGMLTVTEGMYGQNTLQEPSHTFLYADKVRHLQIVWHAVKKEISLDEGVALIGRMAASFVIRAEPTSTFAEMRDRPRKEAEDRARKRRLALETLAREGFRGIEPGKPMFKDGVYVEWMVEPEARIQLLLPLGRVKATPNVMGSQRPRPANLRNADNTAKQLTGIVGWWDYWEDEWAFHNNDNAYLPMSGVGAKLSADHRDPAWVFFYYSATVRVDEVPDDQLTTLRWFYESLPEVRELWKNGKLVKGLMDEAPFPMRPSPPSRF